MPSLLLNRNEKPDERLGRMMALTGLQEREDANTSNMAFRAAEAERRAQAMALREQEMAQRASIQDVREERLRSGLDIQNERLQFLQDQAAKKEADAVDSQKRTIEFFNKTKDLSLYDPGDIAEFQRIRADYPFVEGDERTTGFMNMAQKFGADRIQAAGEQRRAALSQQGKAAERTARTAENIASEKIKSQAVIAGLNSFLKEQPDHADALSWRGQLAQEQKRLQLLEAEKPGTAASGATPAMSDTDRQAADWAKANPNDPRAAKIRQKLGL